MYVSVCLYFVNVTKTCFMNVMYVRTIFINFVYFMICIDFDKPFFNKIFNSNFCIISAFINITLSYTLTVYIYGISCS